MMRLADARIVLCGAGALGSHLAEHLLRQGARQMTVIDFDRVEQHNLGTQSYEEGDIGALKVDALRARCYRATGVEIVVVSQPLTERNAAKRLRHADLVLDTFDTSAARRLVTDTCATLRAPLPASRHAHRLRRGPLERGLPRARRCRRAGCLRLSAGAQSGAAGGGARRGGGAALSAH